MIINHINNRYKIVKQLGEGGMGSVLLAEDLANSNRLTAIKTIKPKFLENSESLFRFKHEYEIMNRLQHPNLAKVFDFSELDDGGYYLAMEYINGQELNQVISNDKKLEFGRALPIIIDLLRAMEFIHSRNIIYSDIKPQNILITENNQVKLIDFGLSDFGNRISKNVKGTMKYVAPEVINGEAKDYRADIFSLGVLFYEMLSGELFYPDSSVSSIISKLTSKQEYKSVIDIAFENLQDSRIRTIIEKMCAFLPKDRFSCCADVISAINDTFALKIPIETAETKEAFVTGVPFTGREKELKYLENFLESHENKLLLVTGKQGVGKSRLFSEFQKQCNLDGVLFLQGSSASGESYEPFLSIVSEVIFLFSDKISEQRKKYLHKLLPDHPVFSSMIVDENAPMESKTLKEVLVETISAVLIDYSIFAKNRVVIVFNNFSNADEISLDIVNEILYKLKNTNLDRLKLYAECRSEEQKEIADYLNNLKEKDRLKILKINEFTEYEVSLYIKNTFGSKSLDNTLSSKIGEIYNYCGGNPFFLQELLKTMIADDVIARENSLWELKKSISSTKLSTGLKGIIKKRIDNLNLKDAYQKGLIFLSLSNQKKTTVEFYQKFVQPEIDIQWQSLFDLLVKKEFLTFKDGFFSTQNQIFRDVLHETISKKEIIEHHRLWIKILEKKCPPDFKIEEIEKELLFDLGQHYQHANYLKVDKYLEKTGKFLLEMGRREKMKFANKKAIIYFSKLQKEIDNFEQQSDELLKFKIKVYANLAKVYEWVGKWEKAVLLYESALDRSIKIGDNKLLGESKFNLGSLFMNKGKYQEAMQLFDETKSIAELISDRKLYSQVLGNIAIVLWHRGDLDGAMQSFLEQKEISEEINDQFIRCKAIGGLGVLYWGKDDLDMAMQCYEEQKQISISISDKSAYSTAIGNMGILYREKGDYKKTMQCYDEYKQICLEMGDKKGYAILLGNMGAVYSDIGDYEKAMNCFLEKKLVNFELGDRLGYSNALYSIGGIYYAKNEYDKAMQYYDDAIKMGRELQVKFRLCFYLHSKAILLFTLKDYENSKSVNQEANLLATEVKNIDVVYSSKILEFKMIALENPNESITGFKQMIQTETSEYKIALLYYEIFVIDKSSDSRQKALELYQKLYMQSPNLDYKDKIDELSKG